MKLPCKKCICLAICKAKVKKEYIFSSVTDLYRDCSLLRIFYLDEYRALTDLLKFFQMKHRGKKTIVILDLLSKRFKRKNK